MGKKKAKAIEGGVKAESNIIMLALDEITPYGKNVKNHTPAKVKALADEIKNNGFDVPLVLDEDFVILKGHKRHLAAQLLKMSEVPCIVRSDLSKMQKRKIRIADNKLNDKDWDIENLREEIEEIMQDDDDFEAGDLGFDDKEFDDLFSDDEAESDDDEPKPDKVKKEKRTIESHRTTTVETETPLDEDGNELRKTKDVGQGSKEYKPEQFEKFDHICPRCKFEFNVKDA